MAKGPIIALFVFQFKIPLLCSIASSQEILCIYNVRDALLLSAGPP
jgi:hypothetical protein